MPQTRWFPSVEKAEERSLDDRPTVRHDAREGWDTALDPAVEVIEREGDVLVRVHMPGVRPGDVEVRAARDALEVRGERHEDPDASSQRYMRRETTGATYARRITLPADVDSGSATATFRDGVLEAVVARGAHGAGGRLHVSYGGEETVAGIPDPNDAEIAPEPGGRPKDLRDRTDIRWPGGNLDAEGPYPESPDFRQDWMSGGSEEEIGWSSTTGGTVPGGEHLGFPTSGQRDVDVSDLSKGVKHKEEVPADDDDDEERSPSERPSGHRAEDEPEP